MFYVELSQIMRVVGQIIASYALLAAKEFCVSGLQSWLASCREKKKKKKKKKRKQTYITTTTTTIINAVAAAAAAYDDGLIV